MLDEILRAFRELLDSQVAEKIGEKALDVFVREYVPQAWEWVKEHKEDMLSTVLAFLGFG